MANDQQNSNYGAWGPTDPQHSQWQPPQNEQSFQQGAELFQQTPEGSQDFQATQQWAPQASGTQPLPPEWQTDQTQQIPQTRPGWGDPQQAWGQAWNEPSQPTAGWENSNFQQQASWGQPSNQWDQQSGHTAQWEQPPAPWDQVPPQNQQWATTPQQHRPSQASAAGNFFSHLTDFTFAGVNASGFVKTLYLVIAVTAILGWLFGVLLLFQFGSLFAAAAWLDLLFGWIGALMWIGVGRAFLDMVATQQSAREELGAISQHTATIEQNTTPAAEPADSEQGE